MSRHLLLLILVIYTSLGYAQKNNLTQEKWSNIAMINEVQYANGESYIHPSFEYAATGFLIDTGKDTLAVTAKHVLWIAKTKSMDAVDLQGSLEYWIMHPKGNTQDSVVIDQLLNSDLNEKLSGVNSTITQRDWLVFTTKYVSPAIQPLKVCYKALKAGEKVKFFGCPYQEKDCITREGKVLEVEGSRIVFSYEDQLNIGGASGSPIVDEQGLLVGILSGTATSKSTGENALFGTSTHYLKKILEEEKPLNVPLVSMTTALQLIITNKGITKGLQQFERWKKKKKNFFIYNFSPESINDLADQFVEDQQVDWAIQLYQLSIEELPLTSTYTKMGKAYLAKSNRQKGIESFRKALELYPENEEAIKELKQLECQ